MEVTAIKCKNCGDIIYSRARHDYRECSCGQVAIDGGQQDYVRIAGIGFDYGKIDIGEVTLKDLYDDWNQKSDKFGIITTDNPAYLNFQLHDMQIQSIQDNTISDYMVAKTTTVQPDRLIIAGIDPGTTQSAYTLLDAVNNRILNKAIVKNEILLNILRGERLDADVFVIEQIKSYGQAVGDEVFETVKWCGRFIEALDNTEKSWKEIPRREVKSYLCGTSLAKDANIRVELTNRYGDFTYGKTGKGTKEHPGQLYGFADDMWAALAVAVAWMEKIK